MPVPVRRHVRRHERYRAPGYIRPPKPLPGEAVVHSVIGDEFYHDFTERWTGKKWADTTEDERDLAALEILDRFARHEQMEFKEAMDRYEKTNVHELRERHGLDTDRYSEYFRLRQKGKSDKMAQFMVYKSQGFI